MNPLTASSHRLPWCLTVCLLVVGCQGEPSAPEVSLAKGGPAGPKVTAADPDSGTQGQRLNVRVLGSGFNQTAVASWERNGVADPRITVHSTSFVSASEVVADISIAGDADTVSYDIAVEIMLADGGRKKGVGIEKFTVQANQGGGTSDPANSQAVTTGAVVSDGPQPVDGFESDTTVHVVNAARQDGDFHAGFAYALTYAAHQAAVAAGLPPCKYNGKKNNTPARRAGLFAKLVDPTMRPRIYAATVWKPSIGGASASHDWHHTWTETTGGVDSLFSSSIKEASKLFPGVFPTVTELAPYTYQFTGGIVSIWDRTGGAGDHLWIGCPNLDAAVITWFPPATP